MTRSLGIPCLVALVALGCNRDDLGRDQRQERRELAREQSAERRELTREQSAERGAAREEAQEELGDRAANVQEQRQDLAEANRDLAATIALACQGVANADACPIPNGILQSSADVEHGVTIVLSNDTGSREEVQRRIDCYRARVTLRGAPEPGACIIDLADQNVTADVTERNGHVVVTLSSANADWVTRVRDEARHALANLRAGRGARTLRN